MDDCSNAEIRDQLPDLLHERLEVSARAVVLAHVATCLDCRDELQLLRDVLSMAEARTPQVDIAFVVRGLPKPPVARLAPLVTLPAKPRRRVWADWRIAAAVTLLVAGGSSAVLLNRGTTSGRRVPAATVSAGVPASGAARAPGKVISVATGAAAIPETTSAAESSSVDAGDPSAADLGNGSRLSDLSADQLQTLLQEVNHLPAVPVTDPEPVTLRVNPRASASDGA